MRGKTTIGRMVWLWAWTVGVVLSAGMVNAQPRLHDFVNCPQSSVNAGLCGATTDGVLLLVFKTSLRADGVETLTDALSYQTTLPCSANEVRGRRGVLIEAGVAEASCSAGQLGTTIANPQTREDFLHRVLFAEFSDRYKDLKKQEAAEAAAGAVEDELNGE